MKISLITFGKTKHKFFSEAEKEFLMRLKKFCCFQLIEISEEKLSKSVSAETAKKRESEKLFEKLPQNAEIICLDESGKEFIAQDFSHLLQKKIDTGKEIVFLIGGANGLHNSVLEAANIKWALGKMTLTQDLARIVFYESLFRGFCILKNLPFHR